ncbi:MAG: phage terminase large subunit [Methanothrix sp.]|jgi:predicted phage terminase large subunit-like protein|nr:phage terminase large subunit [Methanothrix sp.]
MLSSLEEVDRQYEQILSRCRTEAEVDQLRAVCLTAIRRACESSLETFVRVMWRMVEPNVEYLHNWHMTLICEYLQAVTEGKINRLAINIPPRYSKSTLVSVMWPCWEWAINPAQKWVFSSYSAALSEYMSRKRRDLIKSHDYQALWGRSTVIRPDYDRLNVFMSTRGGLMYATSTGGSVTGMGGNRLVIDDPASPMAALSDAGRETVNEWFFNTFLSRLDDKSRGSIVLIQQRLHQNDLTGFLTGIESADLVGSVIRKNGWTLLRLPVIAEIDEVLRSPLDGRVIVERHAGDILWPAREGPEQIEEHKRDAFTFAAQYQQRPTPATGAIFQREWLQFYDELPEHADKPVWAISVDASFYGKDLSNYVAIGIWAGLRPNMYLHEVVRRKMSFTETVSTLRALLKQYPATSAVLIESAANGPAIIDELQRDVGGVIPIKPAGSKEARAFAVTPYFQAGNVYIRNAHWTPDYISELLDFPAGAYDDQVDMTTQAISYIQHTFNRRPAGKHRLIITRPR